MAEQLLSYSKYLVLLSLIAFPLFWQLDALPVRIYDEARAAVNAQEMLRNSDWLEPHFEGTPDMWATKPPLLIWCQSALMKVIGQNEWAVRLPSAIAAFLTCITLLFFSILHIRSSWFGAIVMLALITINGYVENHSTRTGDYDALLTLFTTISGLSFFLYTERKGNKFLLLFFLFTALAVLTKGVAGLLFLPALGIYIVAKRQLLTTLKKPQLYLGLIGFVSVALGYYVLREFHSPGYLKTISENELGGRFLETQEQHGESFWFYYKQLATHLLKPWVVWTFLGALIGMFSPSKLIKNLTLFSVLMIICFSVVISSAQTKLIWYPIPMYPFMAILAGITVLSIFKLLKDSEKINRILRWNFLPYVFLIAAFYQPYRWTVNRVLNSKEKAWDTERYSMANYLRQATAQKDTRLDDFYLVHNGYDAHNIFYINVLKSQGISLAKKDKRELNERDLVLVYQTDVKSYLKEHYNLKVMEEINGITKYEILE
ncbi:MAG: ArnT family glycosyltransferase [Flavobacteriales bacterium]